MKTALLVSAITPMSFFTSHSSAALQQGCTATKPETLFVAVHPCCNAAELCEVKKLSGVIALTSKAVFHLASQSSTGEVSTNRVSGFIITAPVLLCEAR